MKKVLKYYWYINPSGWNAIYDIHLYNLSLYKDAFDEVEFIISFDCGETDLKEVDNTISKLREIYPDAKFTAYQNDKENRESKYFYYEIENKLDQFDDNTAIFFAHNKGLSTTYVTRVDCVSWINLMYYYNLRFMTTVNKLLEDENVCAIGHFKMYYPHWDKCKYKWHFPGTFFWIVPSRIKKHIDEIGEGIPTWFDRYSTEGFLGTIFEYKDKKCVQLKPSKGEYVSIRKWLNDHTTEEEKAEYSKIYGSVFDNKSSLDIFVFAHKPFKIERTNPCYKIVTSSDHEDITSDTAPVLRLNCMLSNIGFSEWQKIFQLFLRPQNLKDYIGLAHFHRYLKFSDDINYIPNMDDEFKECDCITKQPTYLGNLRKQYAFCHNVEDFDIVMGVIKEKYPEYVEAADIAIKRGLLIDSNIMILKKSDFILLCKFVFDVLFEYCRRVGINPCSDESFINYMKAHEEKYAKKHLPNDDEHLQQARICSFLAERLVIIYLTQKKFKLRMYEMVEK